ncbi:MAG: PaaI family thioesterase [Alphaproteobacteria bacterium]|nr:PaaI family thioesterase [Alphaproteobacteria bacterium]MCB9927985.1 PaaI family thioesterase [Alphaproteobacteria bacterium]
MTGDLVAWLNDNPLPFARLLGIRFTEASHDRLTAEMLVRDELCTRPAICHGGALMAFADTMGGAAAMVNLDEGFGTTTLESKTNFLAGAPAGAKLIGETTALHKGRSTMVWQTRVTVDGGRLAGVVTQTQMVLAPRK